MSRRSTPLIGVGAAALAVGALAAFAGMTSDKGTGIEAGPAQAAAAEAAAGTELKIPEGKQALAVALDPVAGTAGVARAGSHIDVFAAVTKKDDKGGQANAARLILQNVEVLRVDGAGVAAGASAPAPTSTTFVLAVTATQAEKLVYHAAFSRLWFSVVPNGQAPVPPTPGVSTATELTPEAA